MAESKDDGISMLNTPMSEWTVLDKLNFSRAYNDQLSDKLGHAEGARTLENYYRQEYNHTIDRLDADYIRLNEMSESFIAYLVALVKDAAPTSVAVPWRPETEK